MQRCTHGAGKTADTLAAAAIGLKHGHALPLKRGAPLCRRLRIGKVRAVEHDDAGFLAGETVNVRVAARHWDACIQDLTHGVNLLHVLLNHALRLRHVARKPLNFQLFKVLRHVISQLQCS